MSYYSSLSYSLIVALLSVPLTDGRNSTDAPSPSVYNYLPLSLQSVSEFSAFASASVKNKYIA